MFTSVQLAQKIDARVIGDTSLIVVSLCSVQEKRQGAIFPVLKRKYGEPLSVGQVALTSPEIADLNVLGDKGTILVHPLPIVALAKLIELFFPAPPPQGGIHPSAVVDSGCDIDITVAVGPNSVIESNVVIGEGSVIGPGAVICANSTLGKYVVVGPGAVIGHEGFGFVPMGTEILKIPQVGRVEIGDFVEIGANSCVDRGTIGKTVIGEGSKLDNMVQVGHNAVIGKNVIIAAQTGLAGSTTIEDGAMLGGQVGVADHLRIGAGAKVGGKSGVTKDVGVNKTVSGYPAMSRWQWLRVVAKLKKQ